MATPKTIVTPKKWFKQMATQKKCYPKKNKKMATPKKMAYFIARGFIIAFWKNGVLYAYGFINAIQTLTVNIYPDHGSLRNLARIEESDLNGWFFRGGYEILDTKPLDWYRAA